MGKLVMGKEISSLTQEEMNELMREMRSRRKGTNGREGYKNPYGLLIETNNFPDPSKKWKPGMFAKEVNEHIKCVFVCPREIYPSSTAYKQTKIYYIGFLSDSNKYSFEEFRESPSKQVPDQFGGIKYRLMKYCSLFEKKNIDKDTTFVLCNDGVKETDFMPVMLKFIHSFSGCDYTRISKTKIIRGYIRQYGIFNTKRSDKIFPGRAAIYKNCDTYKPRMLHLLINEIYTYVTNEKICPWITKEIREKVLALSKYKKHSEQLVSLGLFYSVIMKFIKISNKKLKST